MRATGAYAGREGMRTPRGDLEAPRSHRAAFAVLLALGALALPAVGAMEEEAGMALEIRSPRFRGGGEIPREYTCEGRDVSPPLTWSGVPEGARSLALVVDDP